MEEVAKQDVSQIVDDFIKNINQLNRKCEMIYLTIL